jgi:hypothetical protein
MPRGHHATTFVRSLLKVQNLFYFGAALVAGFVIAVPLYIYFTPTRTNQLEEAIKQLRFIPITPPTTLRAPGTIYVVGKDGQVASALCQAAASQLKDVMASPRPKRRTRKRCARPASPSPPIWRKT